MARTKPTQKTSGTEVQPSRRISEDWLATALGLAMILLIYLGDITVKWPIFE
ncbi:MAG: hypothetical protein HY866_11140, partial [Chloroflexi bacterium]|nr:hypothetical protein [Chloroflexota bacterium]